MKKPYELNKNLFIINDFVYCTDDASIKNESAKAGDYIIYPYGTPNKFSLRQILEVQEYNYKCDIGLLSIKGSMIKGVVVFTTNPELKNTLKLALQAQPDEIIEFITKLRDDSLNCGREHWKGEYEACNAILAYYEKLKSMRFHPPSLTGLEIEFRNDHVISGGLRPVDEIGGKGLQFHDWTYPATNSEGKVIAKPIY